MERPFIDFYNSQQTLPVRQNISDPRFLDGRSFLYSRLGIPLRFLKGMEIIEFGPGGDSMQQQRQNISQVRIIL